MKQAKTEAAVVVDKYKKDKESEFATRAAATGLSAETATLERQTESEIAEMNIQFETNKQVRESRSRHFAGFQLLTLSLHLHFLHCRPSST